MIFATSYQHPFINDVTTENTLLLPKPEKFYFNDRKILNSRNIFIGIVVAILSLALVATGYVMKRSGMLVRPIYLPPPPRIPPSAVAAQKNGSQEQSSSKSIDDETRMFPSDFVWGVATSSYQIEGAVHEDGRGKSVWDTFCAAPKTILDHSNGDIACDHYHRMPEDVQLIKKLHISAYRFSIAWSRILPNGTIDGGVNQAGIDFYNRLINELIRNNITPWITLFHWDLPQVLEDQYGGWLNPKLITIFSEDYARLCFQMFGDRVKHWITINEACTVAVNGYDTGVHAPGRTKHPTTDPYRATHTMLLAHARASKIYKTEFATKDATYGIIGMANAGDFRFPQNISRQTDWDAAERAMIFQFGWLVHPLVYGDYPDVMKDILGDRLPIFTQDERDSLIGSTDFLGLNYYSSALVSKPAQPPQWGGYWADINVDFGRDPSWRRNDMGWNVVPHGLYDMLVWIAQRYKNPVIYITENGSAELESNSSVAIADDKRTEFIRDHLAASSAAIMTAGVNLKGFFAWSLLDNFEWQFGYQRRFGICRVDFDTLKRTPKKSAHFYKETIRAHGQNLPRWNATSATLATTLATPKHVVFTRESDVSEDVQEPKLRRLSHSRRRNCELPNKVLMGYGSNAESVRRGVHNGVNVVAWAFLDIVASHDQDVVDQDCDPKSDKISSSRKLGNIQTDLDLNAIRALITELDSSGYDHVVHLVSFGGWNGPHIDKQLSSIEWYMSFKEQVGDIFDGIDWDLEGNDQLDSRYNLFSVDCLNKMGTISEMAKADGYFIAMAPPQSYFDKDSTRFSRYVNLTDSTREWHNEFSYFGANVYSYLMARFGQSIDLVSVQFYESYSRAAMVLTTSTMTPADYLQEYVSDFVQDDNADEPVLSFLVNFDEDHTVELSAEQVHLPLSKFVIGLANAWAIAPGCDQDKTLFISPSEMQTAWELLTKKNTVPRGLMFWTLEEEGTGDYYFANELSRIISDASDAIN